MLVCSITAQMIRHLHKYIRSCCLSGRILVSCDVVSDSSPTCQRCCCLSDWQVVGCTKKTGGVRGGGTIASWVGVADEDGWGSRREDGIKCIWRHVCNHRAPVHHASLFEAQHHQVKPLLLKSSGHLPPGCKLRRFRPAPVQRAHILTTPAVFSSVPLRDGNAVSVTMSSVTRHRGSTLATRVGAVAGRDL